MFKVGMGETPEAPECLSEEGHEFLSHCLEHDPKLRWTTVELLQHHFCKVRHFVAHILSNFYFKKK